MTSPQSIKNAGLAEDDAPQPLTEVEQATSRDQTQVGRSDTSPSADLPRNMHNSAAGSDERAQRAREKREQVVDSVCPPVMLAPSRPSNKPHT